MNLREIKDLLDADVICGSEFLDREVNSAFACDLMSDVLAFVKDKAVLLTGLVNTHTVRTAEMMDIGAIVFVRGKMPDEDAINLAKENEIVIMSTKNILYTSCGILYNKGLEGSNITHR